MSGLYDVIASRYGDPQAFVRRLKSTMLLHGITQGQLARKSGHDRANITNWLGGGKRPSLKTMVTLDEALDELIQGAETTGYAA